MSQELYSLTIQVEHEDDEFRWIVIQDFGDEVEDMETLGHGIAGSAKEAYENALDVAVRHTSNL
jgi:hypothetical protein